MDTRRGAACPARTMNEKRLPRIMYVANARMPTEKAHGIQIAKMCEAFIEQGVDIELVVPSRGTDVRSLKEFYGLRTDVPMTRRWVPDWYGSRVGFAASSLVFAIQYFLHLGWRRYIRREGFIIYTTDLDQFSFFLLPFLGVLYFAEMHDAKKKRWAFRLLFWRVRATIAVNDIIKKELEAVFSIPPENIMMRPNGYDAGLFRHPEEKIAARHALGLPPAKNIALYVGRIYPWKGLDTLVHTARLLPDVLFYLVGGTADALQMLGEGIPPNLVCAGSRDHAEIPRWLWAADVLLVFGTEKDAYSYFHTSPMKLFEYMAAFRPIVASRTPAIETAVSEEKVFFCAPDDSADAAERIQYVLTHSDEAHRKVAHAAGGLYSWDMRAADITDFMLMHL